MLIKGAPVLNWCRLIYRTPVVPVGSGAPRRVLPRSRRVAGNTRVVTRWPQPCVSTRSTDNFGGPVLNTSPPDNPFVIHHLPWCLHHLDLTGTQVQCRLLIVSPIMRLVDRGQRRGMRSHQGQYPLWKHHCHHHQRLPCLMNSQPTGNDQIHLPHRGRHRRTTRKMPCLRFCKSSDHNHHEGHPKVHRPPSRNQDRCSLPEWVRRLTDQHTSQVKVKHQWQFQHQWLLAHWTNQQIVTEYLMKMVIPSYKYIPAMVLEQPVVIRYQL